jgi:hypothetical protein
MCHNVEKPRTNAVKTMASLWSSATSSVATVRLFLDFRIPQKVMHCFHAQGARTEAASFVTQALAASKAKSFDPMYVLLRCAVNSPVILGHCTLVMRSIQGNETIRPMVIEILRNILYGESPGDVLSLVASDNVWVLAELVRDPQVLAVVSGAVVQSPAFFAEVLHASSALQRALEAASVAIPPPYDPKAFDDNLDIRESLMLLKRCGSALVLAREVDPVLVGRSVEYFKKMVAVVVRESESVAKFLDTQAMRATRFDAKESAFMKAQNKAKEAAAAVTQSTIAEMCRALFHFFRRLSRQRVVRDDILGVLEDVARGPIPACRLFPHPVVLLHHAIQRMFLFAMTAVATGLFLYQSVRGRLAAFVMAVWKRDIDYAMYCASKETTQAQLLVRYPTDRALRWSFVEVFLTQHIDGFSEILAFILQEMIHNPARLKVNAFCYAKYLEFPARSEAVEIVSYILRCREKMGSIGKELVNQMVAMKFIEKERKFTDTTEHILLIESSVELLETILSCETEFPSVFVQEVQQQLDSLRIRFAPEWNRDVVKMINTEPPRPPVNRASVARAYSSLAKSQGAVSLLTKRNGPKIATVKFGSVRAATSLGTRK